MLMLAGRQGGTNGQGKWYGADCCEGTRRCHLAGSCFTVTVAVRHSELCLLWPPRGFRSFQTFSGGSSWNVATDVTEKRALRRARGSDLMHGPLCRDADSGFVSAESWVFLVYDLVIIASPPIPRINVSPDSTLVQLVLSYTTSPSPWKHANCPEWRECGRWVLFFFLLKLPVSSLFPTRSLSVPSSTLIVPLIRLLQSTWRTFAKKNLQAAPHAWGSVSGVYLLSFQAVMV